jgi:hypothetical protein
MIIILMTEFVSNLKSIDVQTVYTRATTDLGNRIILDTEFQRDVVWSVDKQCHFIESIMKGIIPTNIILNNNRNKSECIDGKQRITSIILFIENKIEIMDDNNSPIKFKDLNNDIKSFFLSASIPLVEYKELTYDQQRDIFERIQNGVALTQGELVLSQFKSKSFVKEYSKFCEKFAVQLGKYFNVNRREHYLFIIHLLYLTIKKSIIFSKSKIRDFVSELESNNHKLFNENKNNIEQILNELFNSELLNHKKIIELTISKLLLFAICYFVSDKIECDSNDNIDYIYIRNCLIKIIKESHLERLSFSNKNLKYIETVIDNIFT